MTADDHASAAVDRVVPAYHVEPCMHERWASLRQLCDTVDRRLCLDCSAQFEVDLVDAATTDDVCDTCGCPRLRTDEAGSFPVDATDPDDAARRLPPG